MYECSLERMTDKIKTMSQFGDAGHGGITRYSLSPEALQARGEFVRRMEAIGATIKFDDMANLYATLPGSEPDLPGIVMASHCDSVKNGGNYDGILGVMGAMEVLETVADQNIPHKHNLTAMIWTNEEGSLYPPAMMSSGVICYDYLPEDIRVNFKHEDMLKSTSVLDATKTFGAALDASGYKGDKANRLNNKDYKAMFELHIEQGPILEAAGNDIGVVTCVLGMVNYTIKVYGQSDHAGTTPMKYRQDALYGASKVLQYLHDELDKLDPELVYTTGEIFCHPNVHTVIPDYVEFSLDARHEKPEVIEQVVKVIENIPKEVVKCRLIMKLHGHVILFTMTKNLFLTFRNLLMNLDILTRRSTPVLDMMLSSQLICFLQQWYSYHPKTDILTVNLNIHLQNSAHRVLPYY